MNWTLNLNLLYSIMSSIGGEEKPASKSMVEQWRKDLFNHTMNGDLDQLKSVLEKIKMSGKSPLDTDLRIPKNKTTILHIALQHAKLDVANYIIGNKEYNGLLTEKCLGILSPRGRPWVNLLYQISWFGV